MQRFDCAGIHLTSPIDRMPPGKYPYLFNVRVLEEGRLEGRPGYTTLIQMADVPNSIRRLNNPADGSYIYVGGGGGNLYAGNEVSYTPVDAGYSGDPLSLIPFRPEGSSTSYMYVFDRLKNGKVKGTGAAGGATVSPVGVPPPTQPPVIEYGTPHLVDIHDGQATAGWATAGTASGVTGSSRVGVSTSIGFILYNDGMGPGWACMRPSTAPNTPWAGERMKVWLNFGAANQEQAEVREIHPPIPTTTLASIVYDAGVAGPCSLVLTGNPSGLERNSMIQIGSEAVRVLEVVPAPGGAASYSIRSTTAMTHAAGETVFGITSWYIHTSQVHGNGEPITASAVLVNQATGDGEIDYTYSTALDASVAQGRLIDPANDYLHISLWFNDPTVVTAVKLMLCYDATPVYSFTTPGNASIFTLTPAQYGAGGAQGWVEIVIPIASGTRSGSNFARGLATLTAIAIDVTSTASTSWGFDWWYLFGTYGPTIQPNSPVGMTYLYEYRDSGTNAHSAPSPSTRYQLFPLREAVEVTVPPSPTPGIDTADIFRQGGTVTTPLYVGSTPPGTTFEDTLDDASVLSINKPPDTGSLPPWPLLENPWSGTVNVTGTTVTWVSGQKFDTGLAPLTAININGVTYQTQGPPTSPTTLQLTQSAGLQTNVPYTISSPTVVGKSLPFAFGPLEGPFAPVVFALGDPVNGGNLYYTNFSDADAASDANFLELCAPSSDLVSGACHGGIAFAGNRDQLFAIRYSYLTEIGATPSNNAFQWFQVPAPSGIWSRWACCDTPIGIAYLGRDGIYIATEQGATNISDEDLYPMFPHDGMPARTMQWGDGSSIIPPVDMTRLTLLRLSYGDESIYFDFVDQGGNYNSLRFEIYKKRWFLNHYANAINYHYLVEASSKQPNDMEILSLSLDNRQIVRHGGDVDGTAPVSSVVLTGSDDSKDERMQKLYVDLMLQADGTSGSIQLAATYDNAISFSAPQSVMVAGFVNQFLPAALSSQSALGLHRNIGLKLAWNGGPDGPRIYAWESSGFLQPYLSVFFVTQLEDLSFPGWKHMRRVFPALISNAPVWMTFLCQDGRTYGPYVVPSTGGRYRQLPFLVNHGLKDLAFSFQLDGKGVPFAFFPQDFVVETKEWTENEYIKLAVLRA